MEEIFAPLGNNHRIILDERVERFPFARFPFLLGGLLLLLLLALIGGWIWQRRVTFTLPETPLTFVLPSTGQRWLATQTILPLPSAWQNQLPQSRFTVLVGGTPETPTWMLAPLWIRPPNTFQRLERHGFYRLSAKTEANFTITNAHRLHDTKNWLKPAPKALGAGIWRSASRSEPVFFAWNSSLLTTSLPTSVNGELSERDDLSYLLQNPEFDTAFLATASVNGQGLATWREALERVSWTDTPAGRSSELIFRAAVPSNNAFLPSFTTERRLLQDDSTSNLLTATSSLPTSLVYRTGELPSASTRTCPVADFHPFLRVRGNTLDHLLPSLLPSSTLHLIEVGSFRERLAICLD